MNDSVFTAGQRVESTNADGLLGQLTKGKVYTVLKYKRSTAVGGIFWRACVSVIGDSGKELTIHSHRFEPLAG